MPAAEFSFQDAIDEIIAIAEMADAFLRPGAREVLADFERQLSTIRGLPAKAVYPWSIGESWELRTRTSEGRYERNGKGTHKVFARLTCKWEIEPLGPPRNRSAFSVSGVASTRIRLVEECEPGGQRELAMWRMEIANPGSPGCFFHVQVRGQDNELPFPKSLSIPRLVCLPSTPMVALEFVLAELFQDDWRKRVAEETGPLQRWRSVQLKRLNAYLEWQRQALRSTLGSPWVQLKRLQPAPGMFV